jgi:hypothetical protein
MEEETGRSRKGNWAAGNVSTGWFWEEFMRFTFRTLLVVVTLSLAVPAAFADHFVSNCPLDFIGSAPANSAFLQSPHGVFKNGGVIYSLRGQHLVTMNITQLGDVQVVRDDIMSTLAPRETVGGVAYQNGFLFVSGEGGLEIYDLRNTRGGVGSSSPILVSRTAGLHYRRLALNGNLLAGLYPATDLPCFPEGTAGCRNSIDIFSIANLSDPTLLSRISSNTTQFIGFNDIAWVNGYLFATGLGGTYGFDLTNPSVPVTREFNATHGTFLATNGTNLLGIGQETLIGIFTVGPGSLLRQFQVFVLPSIVDRANPLMFHPEAWMEDGRLITMVDEKNPATFGPARTIAFDVDDFSVPFYEGFDDRIYENVSFTYPDEIKYDPISVGSFVYVTGELSGTQVWGACGVASGRIEFDNLSGLTCGGAEIHGYVTGTERITRVELFLDNTSIGLATITNPRNDVSSPTPVFGWRLPVNFDSISKGNRVLRAVATDVLGTQRQFASKTILFNGPGQNCTSRRRAATKH